jgi:hypothetical protein
MARYLVVLPAVLTIHIPESGAAGIAEGNLLLRGLSSEISGVTLAPAPATAARTEI